MEITWNEIKSKIPLLNIIDIRDNYLYNILKIKGSLNIPYQFLIINPKDYLKQNETYYILCEHGNKSKIVSELLNKDGYHTNSILGGIKSYK